MKLDWMALLVTAGFLAALAAAVATLVSVAGSSRGAARRLQRRLAPSPDLPDLVQREDPVAQMVARGLAPLAKLATPTSEGEISTLRTRLVHAGFRSPYALQIFLAAKALLALVGPAAVLWVSAVRPEPLRMAAAWAVALAGVGFFLPNLWVGGKVKDRQKVIERGLPDALDLMVTCVEAGLGLDAAVQRVAAEIVLAHRVLAEELGLTFLEVKAGVKRTDAFRRLAGRTGVQELKTLAATLNQTDMFGTSVSKALRVQAEGMRVRRTQRAEERAAVLSVKMTIPLVVCFLPALLAVILGPAWVNIVTQFMGHVRQ